MLNELAKEIYETAKSKGWHDTDVAFGDCISNLHCELSEAFEEYRQRGIRGINAVFSETQTKKPIGIPIEFADVLIRLLDTCEMYNIDIDKAVKIKMKYNKTREYRHGNKII